MKFFTHGNGESYEIDVVEEPGHVIARLGGQTFILTLDDRAGRIRTAFLSGGRNDAVRKFEFGWTRRDNTYNILIDGISYEIVVRDPRAERAAALARAGTRALGRAEVRAPIPGRITKILVPAGGRVTKDQPVLTLDAMKLENEIQAPRAGTVHDLSVQPGHSVEKGWLLFTIDGSTSSPKT